MSDWITSTEQPPPLYEIVTVRGAVNELEPAERFWQGYRWQGLGGVIAPRGVGYWPEWQRLNGENVEHLYRNSRVAINRLHFS